jgi:hypothetical protein
MAQQEFLTASKLTDDDVMDLRRATCVNIPSSCDLFYNAAGSYDADLQFEKMRKIGKETPSDG